MQPPFHLGKGCQPDPTDGYAVKSFFKKFSFSRASEEPLAPRRDPAPRRRRSRLIFLAVAAFLLPTLVALISGGSLVDPQALTLSDPNRPELVTSLMEGLPRPNGVLGADGRLGEVVGDKRLVYTLDPELQAAAENLLAKNKVPYGAVVAIEPSTGKILAFAEHSTVNRDCKDICQRATYPAASLIKVITSSAALQTGQVTPYSMFTYTGSPYVLSEKKISPKYRPKGQKITTLADALGMSNNIVFAKVGADVVGADHLLATLEDFGFNKEIPFEFPLQMSRAQVPTDRYPLAQTSAGFGNVRLSPVHAALIASAVANGGVMMRPYILEAVTGAAGEILFSSQPQPLWESTTPQIAKTLGEMMRNTVTEGTSRRSFLRRARSLIEHIPVAGKTGSLNGDDPPGRYEWFIGFAPADKPEIAVAAVVVNNGSIWHFGGSDTAALVLREHFHL